MGEVGPGGREEEEGLMLAMEERAFLRLILSSGTAESSGERGEGEREGGREGGKGG